jgi:TRAP-type C4-dicarboxylate transport system permease small subunit
VLGGLKHTKMKIETYDRLSRVVILISLLFTIIVAATSWKWFPTEGDWGHIAEIPPNILNYTALLLPWVMILLYLLSRRLYFGKNF